MKDNDLIWIHIPTPFPVGPVNVCLTTSDPISLVDCGPDTDEARKALVRGLDAAGVKVTDIKRIFLSHFHTDHSGLCRWIKNESGAEVFSHPEEYHYLRDEPAKVQNLWADRIQAFFLRSGVPAGLSYPIILWFRNRGPTLGGIGHPNTLVEGDRISFGGQQLTVHHTPGHSPGSLVFYSPAGKYLISGDTVLPKVTPNPMVELDNEGRRRYSSLSAYLESLNNLEVLPWEKIYPGHGPTFRRRKSLIESLRDSIEQRSQAVKALLGTNPRTIHEITIAMFGELSLGNLFLGASESASHLDLLVERGSALRLDEGGVEQYVKR